MNILVNFLPILLFIGLYVGSGTYFTIIGVDNAFYQLSPTVAIIPAIGLGWILYPGTSDEKMEKFLDGVRHKSIITMCIMFLLAGAFGHVTKSIGSVDATVNFATSLIAEEYLLIGLFLTATFISTAIGTSMGTIATIAPIAAGLINEGAFPAEIGFATVVGGAMFGDSLSVISDTTIAAVLSQEANMKDKLKLNAIIAISAAIITIIILLLAHKTDATIAVKPYSIILLIPYIALIFIAMSGINVFLVLLFGILIAGTVGYIDTGYSAISLSKDVVSGFASMDDIMILSLMVGGLSGLSGRGSIQLAESLSEWIKKKRKNQRMAQFVIAKIVSVFDLLFANNTVAIIFSGEISKSIAKSHNIPRHYAAVWLDVFSCVFQGIIPYGAQILLVSSIGKISPLMVSPYVYFCFVLFFVSIIYIWFKAKLD